MQAPDRAKKHKMDVFQYVQRTTVSPLFAAIERGDAGATENSLLAGANPSEIDKYNKSEGVEVRDVESRRDTFQVSGSKSFRAGWVKQILCDPSVTQA